MKLLKSVDGTFDFHKIAYLIAVLGIGAFFYLLNIKYPLYLDDWVYSFRYGDDSLVDSFADILHGQYLHYFQWGGRSVVHIIAQLLLWMGESWGDVLNTLAYIAFVVIIYNIANKHNRPNGILFVMISVLIWFFLPDFSQNILWITGSANYLWGGLLVVGLMSCYTSYLFSPSYDKEKDNLLKSIAFFIFGILAGWTNENMAVALIFFLVALIIILKIRKISVPGWMYFGLVGAIIGAAMMLAAPGNYIRNKHELYANHKIEETDLLFYFYRFVTVVKLAYVYILLPTVLYFIVLCLYIWNGKDTEKKKKKDILTASVLFYLSSVVALCAMAGSPVFPERAWYGIIILLIIAIIILFANLDLSEKGINIGYYSLSFAILALYVFSCKVSYTDLRKFSAIMIEREQCIETHKAQGIKDNIISYGIFHQNQSKWAVLNYRIGWKMIVGLINLPNTKALIHS